MDQSAPVEVIKKDIKRFKEQFSTQAARHKNLDRKLSVLIYSLTAMSTVLASSATIIKLYSTYLNLAVVVCTAAIGLVTSIQGKRKAQELWLIELHLFHAFSDLEREFEYQLSKTDQTINTDLYFNKIQGLLNQSKTEWQKSVVEKLHPKPSSSNN